MKNRTGSYKKVIFEESDLFILCQSNRQAISSLLELYHAKKIGPMDFTSLYILFFLRLKHPQNYLQGQKKKEKSILLRNTPLLDLIPPEFNLTQYEREKLKDVTGLDLFTDFNLRGIPLSVKRAMTHWYQKDWNIILSFTIPSAFELLSMQVQNSRVLTLIVDPKQMEKLILGKRDPLSFAIHDLMHADEFFNNPISQKGQLGFYQYIHQHYHLPSLQVLMRENKIFKNDFDYVVSDMNAYIIHLLKSFKSAFTRSFSEDIFFEIFNQDNIGPELLNILKKINNDDLTTNEENQLRLFFEGKQKYL